MSQGQILVVEDDPTILEILRLTLEEEGYEVVGAPNGAAALDLIVRRVAQPDVVILDLNMPVMNGWEFARAYRALSPRCAPIVVLTAAHQGAERAQLIQAAAFLPKPFDLAELLDAVAEFCGCASEVRLSAA